MNNSERYCPEYVVWDSMKQRCTNKNNDGYKYYGERGIKICDRWINSFKNFYADMGKRPSKKYTLDRVDNDGDYILENCRWATIKEQRNNTSRNRIIEYKEKQRTLAQWSEIEGINYYLLMHRLNSGWSTERAFTEKKKVSRLIVKHNGHNKMLVDLCKELNLDYKIMKTRVSWHKWPIEKAINTPIIRKGERKNKSK